MNTLVIHPEDSTTDFLKESYIDYNYTVVNSPTISKSKLKRFISEHDRIVMLGHGMDCGLLSADRILIDSSFVYLLKEKICIGVWCNADKFFNEYKLKGFCTGMFISEEIEALFEDVTTNLEEITVSNNKLAYALKESLVTGFHMMKELYPSVNDLTEFNKDKFYELK